MSCLRWSVTALDIQHLARCEFSFNKQAFVKYRPAIERDIKACAIFLDIFLCNRQGFETKSISED
jgi:hypothetical protein